MNYDVLIKKNSKNACRVERPRQSTVCIKVPKLYSIYISLHDVFQSRCMSNRIFLTLQTSNNEDYQRYYRRMLEFAADDPDVTTKDIGTVLLPKILKGNYVHTISASVYNLFKGDHCELTLVRERLCQDTLAVHLQKGSSYTKMFNQV